MLLSEIIEIIKVGKSGYIDHKIYKDINIISAESLEIAKSDQITFLEDNNNLKNKVFSTNAGAIIIFENNELKESLKNKNISLIFVQNPRIAFAEVLNLFDRRLNINIGIDSKAVIDKDTIIGKECYVGPNVFIGKNTKIGNNNYIFPGTRILENIEIGNNNIIYPNCVIFPNTIIKDKCLINSNSVIGSEGFGFVPVKGKWLKMPQTGGVLINSHVEIGTNCCIDRPAVGLTIIGEGTKIDNLVQIGHGVKIGKNCAFAAQVGIAGGAIIGDGVILAGQVGVTNRVRVGNNVIASSKCGIHCDIDDGTTISGFPAMKNKSWLRSSAIFKKLPELAKKLRQLDNK
tara:strand:- start:4598 stop:5632 length:1035 start_codon:yes stop_codon:yes gene_type:complete